MPQSIRELYPEKLWELFEQISRIPRGSKKEEKITEFVRLQGESLGLETEVDRAGNVLIRKPAAPGYENAPTVVLQSHLDMVHQKNSDTEFDFDRDPILPVVDGDAVRARGTTLGADNGIGVAAILSVLSDKKLKHPPLEALFTTDEETGMGGAFALEAGMLRGNILLNLDTEDDRELIIGCAGGEEAIVSAGYTQTRPGKEDIPYRIFIGKLKGGHSGMDIHLGRANACKLLSRFLYKGEEKYGMRIARIQAGGLRNAIPREGWAEIVIEKKYKDVFLRDFEELVQEIRREFSSVEKEMEISLTPLNRTPEEVMEEEFQRKVTGALMAVQNGISRMSPDVAGLVETSSNLASVQAENGRFQAEFLLRSSLEGAKKALSNSIRAAFEAAGCSVKDQGEYPGWVPNPDSAIVRLSERTYREMFGSGARVTAVHAGLECGIIGSRYPAMEMVSFGPTIRHPHSPDENVDIRSVGKFWDFLLRILQQIASAGKIS